MSVDLLPHARGLETIAGQSERPMRVLHLINGEHYSGAERVQDLLALGLPKHGFEIGFACLKPRRFATLRRSQSTPLFDVGMRNRFDWRCADRIAQLTEREGFQILHAHTPRSLMMARSVARRLALPLVYHVHSPVGRDSTRNFKNRINRWIETWSLRDVERMICVSQSIGHYMHSLGHDRSLISVVPNGVPQNAQTCCRNPGSMTWTLGTVALFRPRKGIEILLEAISLLKARVIPVSLLAVGPFETKEYEREIKDLVHRLQIEDSVRWTGFCDNVDARLMEMDLFVLPSLFGEGLPMVVLEAMAVGLPTIASRVEGIPEAIRDGIDGLIFEAGNPSDLAAKIESLIHGRIAWNSLSRNSQTRQRECFSDESMARGVANVYREIFAAQRALTPANRS